MRSFDVLGRTSAPAVDAILGLGFPVLDDGFVRVLDYMGNDTSIVQAARISYGEGTKHITEDRGLIRYLLRHSHTTPFEMCEIKLHVRVPMDIWRQWIRHRTANVNEYSTRYSVAIDSAHRTQPEAWRKQSQTNRQGSGPLIDSGIGSTLSRDEEALHQLAQRVYASRIECGVAREQARKDLPLSTYTEAYWKIDLHNLFHFLHVRMAAEAQDEIRLYATTIGEQVVSKWVPLAWEAFTDYRRESLQLSRQDLEVIQALNSGDQALAAKIAETNGFCERRNEKLVPNREGRELEAKLLRLRLALEWNKE